MFGQTNIGARLMAYPNKECTQAQPRVFKLLHGKTVTLIGVKLKQCWINILVFCKTNVCNARQKMIEKMI